MAIRRSDQRRRRVGVLLDDPDKVAEITTSVSTARPTQKKSQPEKPAAAYRVSYLTKTSDLIPTRFLSCSLVVLALVLVIATINWLYMHASQMTEMVGVQALEAFSLTGRGSLSQWFTTLLLILSGMASLQIYALRQHRSDDYRGTYRLWLWLALLFLFASFDAAVGIHDMAIHAVSHFTGKPLTHGGWALVTLKLVALTALVVRGIFEVRQSKGALIAVLFVWFAYSGAILMQLPQIETGTVLDYEPVYGNLYLFATVALFCSLVCYARYVLMSAQGLIVAKPEVETKSKAKSESKTKAKSKTTTKTTTKTAATTTTKATTKSKAKSKAKTTSTPATAPVVQAKSKSKSQLRAEAKAAAKAEAAAKAQAKLKADAEAKERALAGAKAEHEAKLAAAANAKAEAIARAKAEIEAKSKAKAALHAQQKEAQAEESSDKPAEGTLPLSSKLSKRKLKKLRKAESRRRAA